MSLRIFPESSIGTLASAPYGATSAAMRATTAARAGTVSGSTRDWLTSCSRAGLIFAGAVAPGLAYRINTRLVFSEMAMKVCTSGPSTP